MRLERRGLSWLLTGFALFLLIYVYIFTGEKFLASCMPIFIGLVIAYPLNIMIGWFERHDILYHRGILKSEKAHRIICVVLAVIILAGCATFIVGYMGPQLTACFIALLDRVPGGIRFLLTQPFFTQVIPAETMETLQTIDWTNWINHLIALMNTDDLFQGMTTTATSALSAFSTVLFGILFAAYFLSGKQKVLEVLRRMVRAFVPEKRQEGILRAGSVLNECFHDFIICQATQALIIGVSATVLMYVFGFPYASMIGTLNGFCALIPVIGGYLGAILGTLMILADSPSMGLFFLIFIVLLQNIIGTLVFPRLIGRTLGLPAAWTLTAVLIGSGLAGISGILIGVPLTAFAYRMVGEKLREREAEKRAQAEREKSGEKDKPEPDGAETSESES